jgi:hypothetical protein
MVERQGFLERQNKHFVREHALELQEVIFKNANQQLTRIKIHEANE